MKRFKFKAKSWSGDSVTGVLEVLNRASALETIRSNNLIPISLDEVKRTFFEEMYYTFFGRPSYKQLTNFTRQLSTMLTAGLALTDALSLLVSQMKGQGGMGDVIDHALNTVRGGESLATGLSKFQSIFGEAYIASIKAGEEGGVLEEILSRLAANMEQEQEFRGKVKGAMIYPVIVVVGIVTVVFVMMVFVVPKLMSLYADFGAKMPAITELLIGISTWVSRLWFLFPLIPVGLFALYRSSETRPDWKLKRDAILLKIPILGELALKSIIANSSRTLSMLLSAGVPLVQALLIVTKVTGNEVYLRAYTKIATRVEKGFPLSDCFSETDVFPVIVNQMVATGEATGKLDEVLMRVADYFTKEAEQSVKTLTSAIEPIIMIMLGGVVGFLVIAVILPIYDLTSQF